MTRSELVQKIADDYPHLMHRDVVKVVDNVLEQITSAMSRGQRVELRGFGAFTVKHRNGRMGRNPTTGKLISIQEKHVPYFKTGKLLFDRLNGKA